MDCDNCQQKRWYVLRVKSAGSAAEETLSQEMRIRSNRETDGLPVLEYFVPGLTAKRIVDGKLENVSRPLGGYVFIKGLQAEILQFRSMYPTFNMIRSVSNTSQYMYVPDAEMRMFRFAIGLFNGCVPFIEVTKDVLENGDYVRVIGGPFKGVEGVLLTRQGKNGGRVIVSVCNMIAIPTLEIEPEYLEVVSFGKDSRHIYQILDSFYPYIRRAAMAWFAHGTVDEKDLARVRNFVKRYGKVTFESDENAEAGKTKRGKVRVDAKKIQGRYLAYMLMCYTVWGVGEDAPVNYYVREINRILPFVTNETTKAFVLCALYAATRNRGYLDDAARIALSWGDKKLSRKQQDVLADINCYKRYHEENRYIS